MGQGLYRTWRSTLALRLAGTRVRLPPQRWGGLADVDTPGRASIRQVFRARGPPEEALRDTREEAEEGSGAILAPCMEPLAQLVPAPAFLFNVGGVFKGLTQTCAQELLDFWKAGLHFLQPLPFRNGSTVLERGHSLSRRVADGGTLTGATAAGGGGIVHPESSPGFKPHF